MIWSPSADHLKNDLKPDLVTNVVLPKQDLVTNALLPKPDLVTNAPLPKPDLVTNASLPKLDLVTNAVLPKSDLAPTVKFVRIRSKNGILLQKGIHYNNCTATTTIQLHRFSFSTTLFQHKGGGSTPSPSSLLGGSYLLCSSLLVQLSTIQREFLVHYSFSIANDLHR